MKKHIVCFGDSNTHGYCADPNDTADHTDRFTEDERWTSCKRRLARITLCSRRGFPGALLFSATRCMSACPGST